MMKDKDLLRIAAVQAASYSDDPRTEVGAVIYDMNTRKPIAYGANRLSAGFTQADLEKYGKYDIMVHAERDALFEYSKYLYDDPIGLAATAACCVDCARAIVAMGVKEVITSQRALDMMPKWADAIEMGHIILDTAGVEIHKLDFVDTVPVKISGETVRL